MFSILFFIQPLSYNLLKFIESTLKTSNQRLNLAKNFAVTRAWGISRRFCTIIKNHDSENGQIDGKIKMDGRSW